MYKLKTNKSVKKRMKLTANGKLIARKPGHGHLLSSKNSKSRRKNRRVATMTALFAKKILKVTHNPNNLR